MLSYSHQGVYLAYYLQTNHIYYKNLHLIDFQFMLTNKTCTAVDLGFNFKECATSGKAASINGTRGLRAF